MGEINLKNNLIYSIKIDNSVLKNIKKTPK